MRVKSTFWSCDAALRSASWVVEAKAAQFGAQYVAAIRGDGHAVVAAGVGGGRILFAGEGVGGGDADAGKRDGSRLDRAVDGAAGLHCRAGLRRRSGPGRCGGWYRRCGDGRGGLLGAEVARRGQLRHGEQKRDHDAAKRHRVSRLLVWWRRCGAGLDAVCPATSEAAGATPFTGTTNT